MSNATVRWGILSTGAIARTFAWGLKSSRTGVLSAVASRDLARARAMVGEFAGARAHGAYEALIEDADVDAVYVATPHTMHAEWAIRAARAGKHVLVEKPFAVNFADADAMADAARVSGVLAMEAFMYRCHPATAELVRLIRDGAIGQVRLIDATFSFHARFNATSRLYANDLAGGGILDVGCYTASIARLVAGAAVGKAFDDPVEVRGCGHLGDTGVDEWAAATLKFAGGIVARLSTGIALNQENGLKVYGSEGRLIVPNPWLANRGSPDSGKILIHRDGESSPRTVTVGADATSFTLEADFFGDAVLNRRPAPAEPAPCLADTLGNLRTLDAWRESIGLTYAHETPPRFRRTTVAGLPLSRPHDAPIPAGRIAGVDKPVSRLVLGVDNQRTFPVAANLFDAFFEAGGNAFDTAHIYGRNGEYERRLGDWLRLRGVRADVVIVGKGAHTPWCEPRHVGPQLQESLARLQVDAVDVYLLHRDNPQVPVGEFVDAMNEQADAGRITGAVGVSNWSVDRVRQANAYARQHGKRPIAVLSNQFSLARMLQPIWPGCVAASDDAGRAFLSENRDVSLLAWSSQARGFFLPGVAEPDRRDNAELVRTWYSPENFERQRRARELAAQRGVEAIHVALAYTLAQPFAPFALIGPRTLGELRSSLAALAVELSPGELAWLDLAADTPA